VNGLRESKLPSTNILTSEESWTKGHFAEFCAKDSLTPSIEPKKVSNS